MAFQFDNPHSSKVSSFYNISNRINFHKFFNIHLFVRIEVIGSVRFTQLKFHLMLLVPTQLVNKKYMYIKQKKIFELSKSISEIGTVEPALNGH